MADTYPGYPSLTGKWVVHVKGGPGERNFEIAIIRDDYDFGKSSYGWFDTNKLLVSHSGGPCKCSVLGVIWDNLIVTAEFAASYLNDKERRT